MYRLNLSMFVLQASAQIGALPQAGHVGRGRMVETGGSDRPENIQLATQLHACF
jgi:hypothetical protein